MAGVFRDMPIGRKLYGSFGVVVVLLGVVAGVSLWAQSAMGSSSDSARAAAGKAQAAADVRGLAAYIHESQTRFVLTGGASYQDHLGDVRDFEAGLRVLAADSTSPADKAHLAAIRRGFATVSRFDHILIGDVRAGRPAAARAVVQGGADAAADSLSTAASAYQAAADRRQNAADRRFSSTRTSAVWLVGSIALVAALLAAAFAFVVGRMISRGLRLVLDRLTVMRDQCVAGLMSGLEAMAAGDLTVEVTSTTLPIDDPSGDEIGQTAAAVNTVCLATAASVDAYNRMRDEMSTLVGSISGVAETIGGASRQMVSTSDDAGRAVGEIAAAISAVAEGAERQARMLEQASATTGETAEAAEKAREVAERGAASATQASQAMGSVNESTREVTIAIQQLAGKSEQIGGIVETITGLADQTNLLALNAAIEAARAGEQGRGFAVVAEEVRKLAEQSQEAAGRIAALIGEIQTETGRVVTVVEQAAGRTEEGTAVVAAARDAFAAIDGAVRTVTAQIHEIAAATGDVANVAGQTSASTEEVSASTQETSASAVELAANAHELAETAATLERLVAGFTTSSR
jgi:methyl-accepting chemotaxis protein